MCEVAGNLFFFFFSACIFGYSIGACVRSAAVSLAGSLTF